jgi:hypothetical protein
MEIIVLEEKKSKMAAEETGRRSGLNTSETQGELFLRKIVQKDDESRGNSKVACGTKCSPGTDTMTHVHQP